MNFRIALQFCCFFTLWASIGFAAGELEEFGGANDNPHNLSSLSSNLIKADTETQICIFCHTPHGAAPQSTLWSRLPPTGTFNPSTLALVIDDIPSSNYGAPNGASKMCLSCHDGVTAIGTLLGDVIDVRGGPDTNMAGAGSTLHFNDSNGGTLGSFERSHPVSFTYGAGVITDINTLLGPGSYKPAPAGFLDGADRVQCTTCHEPHKDTREGSYSLPFWRMQGSGVDSAADYDNTCDACHGSPPTGLGHNNP